MCVIDVRKRFIRLTPGILSMSKVKVGSRRGHMTCRGVARLAGVGTGSVSRVLNGAPNVSPEIRERVLSVVRATNYRRCSAAGMLSRQRYETIGVITEREHEESFYGTSIFLGISRALTQHKLKLAMSMVHVGITPAELQEIPLLQEQSVDGLIVDLDRFGGDLEEALLPLGIPYVLVNPNGIRPYNTIMPNDVAVAANATNYLLGKGHRRIVYLPITDHAVHSSQFDRMRGYFDTLTGAGENAMPWWSERIPKADDLSAGLRPRIKKWLTEDGATAILAYNAVWAARAFRVCYELGVRIPQEVSLMSCDYAPILEKLPVPVTSVCLDREEMGCLAVEMLLKRIEDGADVPTRLTTGGLREMDSVATR